MSGEAACKMRSRAGVRHPLYRVLLRHLIEEYASYKPSHGQIHAEAVIDADHDHYEVMHVGWDGEKRIHGPVLHVDIIDGKFWVQYDGTSRPIADELVAAGVPRDDIVLAFHPEDVRHLTEYAVR